MKRSQLGPGAKSVQRGSTFASRGEGLRRRSPASTRARPVSPASPPQREKVRDRACVVCTRGPCHPAHLVDRSLGGCDDELCVVPLCPACHRAYDEGGLDLLPYLEPHWRDELAHAVQHIGLARTLARVTNESVRGNA